MSRLTVDASHERSGLLARQHLGGLADWTYDLARSALSSFVPEADVLVSTSPEHGESLVELRLWGQPVVLIDVDDDVNGHASIDRLELLAARTWRGVTRNAVPGEIRPWLGAIRVTSDSIPDALIVERLEQLVAARMLDTVCVVIVDQVADDVWSPSPALTIESFQAALIGRSLVLSTLGSAR